MPSEDKLDGQVVLVTGGGRGIGASIARELAGAGAKVAVSARTAEQVEKVASEIGGLPVVADVTKRDEVEAMFAKVESELGPIDVLAANAGIGTSRRLDLGGRSRGMVARARGEHARRPPLVPDRHPGDAREGPGPDRDHRQRRGVSPGQQRYRVFVQQGGGLPLRRDPRERVARTHPGLRHQPGPRQDGHDQRLRRRHAVDAARARAALVHVLASGRADALAGRYIHAEHDDIEDLIARADEIESEDLNAIRLQQVVFD